MAIYRDIEVAFNNALTTSLYKRYNIYLNRGNAAKNNHNDLITERDHIEVGNRLFSGAVGSFSATLLWTLLEYDLPAILSK